MGDLEGRVALVFGASSGIGRATALALARAGAAVAVAARTAPTLGELADEITRQGGRAIALPADVSEREQVDRVVASTVEQLGGIDVVVNAAGVNTQQRRMSELPPPEWDRVLAVNLTGAFNTTQAPLAHLRERGGGLIVQVSSVSGRWGDMSGAAYQASKHGIVGLCQATMFEERLNGIRVTAILPGLVDTPMPMRRPVPPPRDLLDRAMRPDDVALACVFLARLSPTAYLPELIMMPPALQCVGQNAI